MTLRMNLKKIIDWGEDGFVLVSTIGPLCRNGAHNIFEMAIIDCDELGRTALSGGLHDWMQFDTEEEAREHHDFMVRSAVEHGARLIEIPNLPWNKAAPTALA